MEPQSPPGAPARVLTLSTIAFTAMFAVWLMFGVIGIPIQKEFHLSDVQFAWLGAIAVLNGAIWRLPAGVLTDRLGGRRVFVALLLASAVASLAIVQATTFTGLLVCALLVGIGGNSFSAGIAYNAAWFPRQRQGVALGTFGAGNVGASVTKLVGPTLIAAVPAAGLWGIVPGGWRVVPVLYAVLLAALAALLWWGAPVDVPPVSKPPRFLAQMFKPLRYVRVWRFSLYYVIVFGAYVALTLALPKFYMARFGISLKAAGFLAATFIFPASLLRPLGGHLSDRYGARAVMYGVFVTMTLCLAVLSGDRSAGYQLGLGAFVTLVFVVGVAMGLGKAAVFKYVPEYFPNDVGAVGGLVGALGALGGFVLPLCFGYLSAWSGLLQAPFVVLLALTIASFAWMHTAVQLSQRTRPVAVGAG
jgi:NNP family nitrate/nitrite transporter-like MFS transporter